MNKVNIFVSSTCYDLSQIRTDLHESIANLGFNPILSEYPDFPINPSNKTVENCIDAVNNSADILVLIIGNRYGYKLESGKSITNTEFLAAKNKGIPIYVFIAKQIINLLPVYLNNKLADYSNVVDNSEIFEFVNDIRNKSGLWNFEFEKFQDILLILKTQLSYLFKDALSLRTKFQSNPDFSFHKLLSNKALKIILEKKDVYEHEFLSQVMVDEMTKMEFLKKDYEYKLILKNNQSIKDDADFLLWLTERFDGTLAFIPNLLNIVNVLIPKYLGEPGEPADLKGLYYIAHSYSRIYESFVNWTIDTLSVTVSENQKDVRNKLSKLTSKAIETIWSFPFDFYNRIADAKNRFQAGERNITVNMELTLEIDALALKEYETAFEQFDRSLPYR